MSFGTSETFGGSAPARTAVALRPQRAYTSGLHRRAAERVIGAMRAHLDGPFGLDEMAKLAFMSRFHFNRAFRRLTGVPPCLFLSSVRLEAAKRLLLTTGLSITEVCFEVGYNSLGTFVRRFGRAVGVSPGRLRSLARTPPAWPSGSPLPAARPARAVVTGRVSAPPSLRGPIFVGLFTTPIPQGWPVACELLASPGVYNFALAADGAFYLFAAAHAGSGDPADYLMGDRALRGGGQSVEVVDGLVRGSTDVVLRLPLPTDPPILVALPFVGSPEPADDRGELPVEALAAAH